MVHSCPVEYVFSRAQIPFHVCLHGSKKWAKPILSLLLFHYKWISTRHAWEINSQCKLNLMLDNVAEEHNIMGTCVFIIYVSLSEVYDYSGHNILQCMHLVWSVHCMSILCTTESVHLLGWVGLLLIGISETLIQSKCTGIVLFVYYVHSVLVPRH